MKHITTRKAHQEAWKLGLCVSLNTVRDTARKYDLITRLGHKVFIDEAGWMALLERRQPDKTPRRQLQTSA
jgi:hypothetical protein